MDTEKLPDKTYCLFATCKYWEGCSNDDHIVTVEKLTLKEAKEMYPGVEFCGEWEGREEVGN